MRRTNVLAIAMALIMIIAAIHIIHLNGWSMDFTDTEVYVIVTDSMDGEEQPYPIPTIQKDTLVFAKHTDDFAVGDVVGYRTPMSDSLYFHRIIDIANSTYHLKGDAYDFIDTVDEHHIVCKIVGTDHNLGIIITFVKQNLLPIIIILLIMIPISDIISNKRKIAMTEKEHNTKMIFTISIVAVCAIALIGAAYSAFASFTSGNNTIDNDYTTITITNADGSNLAGGVMFDYVQEYNTYSDLDNNITYRLLTSSQKIRLNDESYKLTINGTSDSSKYRLSAKMSSLPILYEDHNQTKRCDFVIELKDDDNSYTSKPTDGTGMFFFKDTTGNDADIPAGEYDLDIYLQMYTEQRSYKGSDPCILVDKSEFVDRFKTNNIIITFLAESPGAGQ